MAKTIELTVLSGVLGALLVTGNVRAEGSSSNAAPATAPRAAELALGACRLGSWAAAMDLLRAVPPEARKAEEWLCRARAQIGLGKWVDALDSYDEMTERAATDSSSRNLQRIGASERQALEARLAWLRVVPSDPLSGDTLLTLDGAPIPRSRLGVEFPVQPGERSVGVKGHGVTQELVSIELREGEHRRLTLSVPLAPRLGPERAALLAAQSPSVPARSGDYSRWARNALYGGALGTGAGIALLAASAKAESDVSTLQVIGLGGVVLGGLGFMGAAVLRLIGDSDAAVEARRAPPRRHIEPWVTSTGAGITGSF
jgi:hypothetical protein